jgi:hypothetical protein
MMRSIRQRFRLVPLLACHFLAVVFYLRLTVEVLPGQEIHPFKLTGLLRTHGRLSRFPGTPIVINFNTNINGPFQGNIAGSISLTMSPDGSFSFSGQDNNSNWAPYDMTVALVVKGSQGTAFAFTTSGNIDAGLPGDNNNWNWSISGNNPTIQAKWSELMAGYTWFYNISATLSIGDLFNGVIAAAKAAGPIVQSVVAVVGALS